MRPFNNQRWRVDIGMRQLERGRFDLSAVTSNHARRRSRTSK
jgi:hypothetical protein